MPEQMNLDDILSGAEPKPEPAPVEATAEPVKAAPERAPDGKFAKPETAALLKPQEEPVKAEPVKAEPKPEPPKEEMTPKEKAYLATAIEERKKRQDLERQLAQRQQPQQPQQPAEAPKPFLEDPDGALKRFEDNVQHAMLQTRLQTAETIARSRYQDYDQEVEVFKRLCEQQPQYFQAALKAPDPAEFAYRTIKGLREREEWDRNGGAEGYRAKIQKEERAKWEAELAAKEKERQKQLENIPPSLSDVQGRGPGSRPVWGGPVPLDDILKH